MSSQNTNVLRQTSNCDAAKLVMPTGNSLGLYIIDELPGLNQVVNKNTVPTYNVHLQQHASLYFLYFHLIELKHSF